MPRKNRFDSIEDNCIVHVRMQINNEEFRFSRKIHFKLWKKTVLRYLKKYPAIKVTAYQWMSNHCHMLIEVKKAQDLPKFMHNINWRFAFEFNKLEDRKGHFFQNRYRSTVVDSDEQELITQRYIHRNQIRAGMVKELQHSKWTSYHYYAYGKKDPIIQKPFRNFYGFGRDPTKRRSEFRIYVKTMSPKEEWEWQQKLKKSSLKK